MNPVFTFLANIALKLVGPILAYLKGRGDEKNKQLKKDAQDAKTDAKAWANRARSDDEYERRLLDAAKDRS